MANAVPSDQEFAARIRDAVKALNTLTMQAAQMGLKVGYGTQDYHVVSAQPTSKTDILTVEITKVI